VESRRVWKGAELPLSVPRARIVRQLTANRHRVGTIQSLVGIRKCRVPVSDIHEWSLLLELQMLMRASRFLRQNALNGESGKFVGRPVAKHRSLPAHVTDVIAPSPSDVWGTSRICPRK